MNSWEKYWNKKIFGIEIFKLNFFFKKYLFLIFRIKLQKLDNQKEYWKSRGTVYRDEFFNSNYNHYEIFFQNMIVDCLRNLKFKSICEAGCGFGWNIKRIKDEFPNCKVEGLDLSETQLENAKVYLKNYDIKVIHSDIKKMPYSNNCFDVMFALGNFQNINKKYINESIDEMIRVSKKYIIHVDSDERFYSKKLYKNRVFKTNISSHNYREIYEKKGLKVLKFLTAADYQKDHDIHMKKVNSQIKRWEGWEDPSKYVFLLVEKV